MTLVSVRLLADEKEKTTGNKYIQNKKARGYVSLNATFLQISTLSREKSEFSPKRLEPPEILICLSIFILEQIKNPQGLEKIGCGVQHTGYPETTSVTDNKAVEINRRQ